MVPKKHTLVLKELNIISTYHHGFAGGSKNTSRLLHTLAANGCEVSAYFFEKPQFFIYTNSNVKVRTLLSNYLLSEVIEDGVLKNYSASNIIIEDAKTSNDFLLFATNLFPYCNILHDVKMQLLHLLKKSPKLIIHPVGSDVWQVGSKMPSRVKWLLESSLVDHVVSYSETFVNEIKEHFSIEREIEVLSPILENDRFFPIDEMTIQKRKKTLGITDAFVMHSHNSMRRVKCPEIVLDIALKAAEMISEKCVLLMVGPVPFEKINGLGLPLIKLEENNLFQYKSCTNNLTIYWTGPVSNVEYFLQISDVEINSSLHDSFNLSLMEAMACGLPVVTSDIVGICNHILNAKAGFVFPTKRLKYDELNEVINTCSNKRHLFDISYAVDAVVHIAKNREMANSMGKSGADYVRNEFSPEKALKQFSKYLDGKYKIG